MKRTKRGMRVQIDGKTVGSPGMARKRHQGVKQSPFRSSSEARWVCSVVGDLNPARAHRQGKQGPHHDTSCIAGRTTGATSSPSSAAATISTSPSSSELSRTRASKPVSLSPPTARTSAPSLTLPKIHDPNPQCILVTPHGKMQVLVLQSPQQPKIHRPAYSMVRGPLTSVILGEFRNGVKSETERYFPAPGGFCRIGSRDAKHNPR